MLVKEFEHPGDADTVRQKQAQRDLSEPLVPFWYLYNYNMFEIVDVLES